MPTARDIMSTNPSFCSDDVTAAEAARQMADRGVGAVPVCNAEGHLAGVITDRDLAVHIIAAGRDPETTKIADLLDATEVVTVGADDSVEEAIRTMKEHAVRRLPVIDGTQLVGMVSQADIARAMPDAKIGDLVDAISSAAANG
jgi:CBS domain-containing protein